MQAKSLVAAYATVWILGGATPASAHPVDDYRWALPDWRQTFSAPRFADERGFAIEATDEAVYVAGVSGSTGEGAGDLILLRYDLSGSLVWAKNWGGFELEQAQDLTVADSVIYVVGSESSEEPGKNQAVLLRFDLDGGLLGAPVVWSDGVADVPQAVAVTAEGIYIGGLTHPTRLDRQAFLARFNFAGDRLWWKTLGDTDFDEIWDLAVANDGNGESVYGVGYVTNPDPQDNWSQALIWKVDAAGGSTQKITTFGEPQTDEARAITIVGDDVWITGGSLFGRASDAFLVKATLDGDVEWKKYSDGLMTGGYGISVGERGIYVAGGTYDFPAGGDASVLRFTFDGDVDWSQIYGLPGFWDWGFDAVVRNDKVYVTGTLYQPGAEWYEILTLAYDESLPTVSLGEVLGQAAGGDVVGARNAMDHFWLGDFLRWAESYDPELAASAESASASGSPEPGRSWIVWEGSSNYGREYGQIRFDSDEEEPVQEDNAVEAITGLQNDIPDNFALVRNFTGVRGSLFGDTVRFRYFISHDRLIPQGGYLYVGDDGIILPPPPV